jgi:hypothetical protein
VSQQARARTSPGREPESAAPEPSTPVPTTARWEWVRALEVLGQRRRFIIDRRSQLRAAALTTAAALVLLVLLNLSLHGARARSAAVVLHDAPELAPLIRSQNRTELGLVAIASVVFLLGVVTVTVLETHKTAGAAFNVARHLRAIREGRYRARLKLRRGDNLMELESAFNDMARGLEERVRQDAEALERFADECEKLSGPDEATRLAESMRERAREERRLLE